MTVPADPKSLRSRLKVSDGALDDFARRALWLEKNLVALSHLTVSPSPRLVDRLLLRCGLARASAIAQVVAGVREHARQAVGNPWSELADGMIALEAGESSEGEGSNR